MTTQERYSFVQHRIGTKEEVTLLSPGRNELAYLSYGDSDSHGRARMTALARLIVDALNAYRKE